MGVTIAVTFALLLAFFGIPAIFQKMAPKGTRALTWFEFVNRGIATGSGHTTAGEATVLVLLLPLLIVGFGIAVTIIAALV